MEGIILEKQTYERLLLKIKAISSRIEVLDELYRDKSLKPWLDTQEVCRILSISKR